MNLLEMLEKDQLIVGVPHEEKGWVETGDGALKEYVKNFLRSFCEIDIITDVGVKLIAVIKSEERLLISPKNKKEKILYFTLGPKKIAVEYIEKNTIEIIDTGRRIKITNLG